MLSLHQGSRVAQVAQLWFNFDPKVHERFYVEMNKQHKSWDVKLWSGAELRPTCKVFQVNQSKSVAGLEVCQQY